MNNENNNIGRELDWDAEIDINADDSYEALPEGEYNFVVKKIEKLRYNPRPGAKLPPCNQVKVTLDVNGREVNHNLFLHSRCEGMLCAFFKAIGARQDGQRLKMEWNRVTGSTGRCVIGIRKWIGKNNEEREGNEVKKFVMPGELTVTETPQTQTQQAPAPVNPNDMPF
jgi:hypothetical protein